MNRDRLYSRSLQALEELSVDYQVPAEPVFELAGGDILDRMAAFMDAGIERGDFMPHDKTVAMQIATVMCHAEGEASAATEQDLYDRERAAFVRLAATPQTRARIHALLHEGGVIRN